MIFCELISKRLFALKIGFSKTELVEFCRLRLLIRNTAFQDESDGSIMKLREDAHPPAKRFRHCEPNLLPPLMMVNSRKGRDLFILSRKSEGSSTDERGSEKMKSPIGSGDERQIGGVLPEMGNLPYHR